MPMKHEEIRTVLPEYLSAGLPPAAADEVKSHISSCKDCQDELTVLVELQHFAVEEPGELFWKTLPGRVAREVASSSRKEERAIPWFAWFWRSVPFAGAALLLAMLIFARSGRPPGGALTENAFAGPFTYSLPDYGSLEESDVPDIELDIDAAEALAPFQGGLSGYGYHGELVALKADEIERFSRAVQKNYSRGG